MATELKIVPANTAVVVIDLQRGITGMPSEPHSSQEVLSNSAKLLNAARKNNMAIFLVHVTPSSDLKDALHPVAENTFSVSSFNKEWSEYCPELNIQPSDFLITKRQWGAFYGTELDLQLRRRGIDTIILCGIATNIGVESTARFAYEYGYNQIFVEDAMAARSKDEHNFPLKYIFPRLGLIRNTKDIVSCLEKK